MINLLTINGIQKLEDYINNCLSQLQLNSATIAGAFVSKIFNDYLQMALMSQEWNINFQQTTQMAFKIYQFILNCGFDVYTFFVKWHTLELSSSNSLDAKFFSVVDLETGNDNKNFEENNQSSSKKLNANSFLNALQQNPPLSSFQGEFENVNISQALPSTITADNDITNNNTNSTDKSDYTHNRTSTDYLKFFNEFKVSDTFTKMAEMWYNITKDLQRQVYSPFVVNNGFLW